VPIELPPERPPQELSAPALAFGILLAQRFVTLPRILTAVAA
jgi:hypothetical protein